LHAYAPHDEVVPGAQAPAPSQTEPCTVVGPAHVVDPQLLPAFAAARQAPFPSQNPSAPHVSADAAHASFGSTSARIGPQSPVDPDTLNAARHDTHAPSHFPSQHTPSVQNPDWHWLPSVHAWPFASGGTHAPPTHTFPVAQSAPVAHVCKHDPPEHLYGAHETGVALDAHVPVPSQTCPVTPVPFAVHDAAPQLFPDLA
jgi:hypothetical protein